MPTCVSCGTELGSTRYRGGLFFSCPQCGSRAVTVPQVRRVLGNGFATDLLRRINTSETVGNRACPFCNQFMRVVTLPEPPLELDACRLCGAIWFDRGEFETVPEADPPLQAVSNVPQAVREATAIAEVQLMAERARREAAAPGLNWRTAMGCFGLPVESDDAEISTQPWVTYVVTALIIVASGLAFRHVDAVAGALGFVPAEPWRAGGVTWVTSFFLHGSLLHLGFNLYFLLVFGDNVEDHLGGWRYAGLLLAATLGGNLLHLLLQHASTIPAIGASGGISGVIVFYALQFPNRRLSFLLGRYYWWWVEVPAWLLLVAWLMLQSGMLYLQVHGLSHTAATAHFGGAVVGFLLWLAWRARPQLCGVRASNATQRS